MRVKIFSVQMERGKNRKEKEKSTTTEKDRSGCKDNSDDHDDDVNDDEVVNLDSATRLFVLFEERTKWNGDKMRKADRVESRRSGLNEHVLMIFSFCFRSRTADLLFLDSMEMEGFLVEASW